VAPTSSRSIAPATYTASTAKTRGSGAIPPLYWNDGAFGGDGGPGRRARFRAPADLAIDRHGSLFVADRGNGAVRRIGVNAAQPDENVVRRIDRQGTITIVAGTGKAGYSGDGGPAAKAKLDRPEALAFDKKGNLYIGDHDNGAIREVSQDGVITTFCDGRTT
jgi:hypothetical protein